MIVFDVSINGRPVCSAGVERNGVLMALAMWRRPENADGAARADELELFVEGGPSSGDADLEWAHRRLQPGDVITIDIVERDQADPARARRPSGATREE